MNTGEGKEVVGGTRVTGEGSKGGVHVARRYPGRLQLILDADGDRILTTPAQQLGHLEGKGKVPTLVGADTLAIDVDRSLVAGRADTQEDPLAPPTRWDEGLAHVPGQTEVVEQIFILLVPTPRDRNWSCCAQTIEPTMLLTHTLGIGLKVPDAR